MSQKIFTVWQLAVHLEEFTFLVTKLLRKRNPRQKKAASVNLGAWG